MQAGEAWFAGAGVAVDIVGAGATILAGGALALVHLDGTVLARESGKAGAEKGVDAVCA